MVVWSKRKNNRPGFLHTAKLNRDKWHRFSVLFHQFTSHASSDLNVIWMGSVSPVLWKTATLRMCSSVTVVRLRLTNYRAFLDRCVIHITYNSWCIFLFHFGDVWIIRTCEKSIYFFNFLVSFGKRLMSPKEHHDRSRNYSFKQFLLKILLLRIINFMVKNMKYRESL